MNKLNKDYIKKLLLRSKLIFASGLIAAAPNISACGNNNNNNKSEKVKSVSNNSTSTASSASSASSANKAVSASSSASKNNSETVVSSSNQNVLYADSYEVIDKLRNDCQKAMGEVLTKEVLSEEQLAEYESDRLNGLAEDVCNYVITNYIDSEDLTDIDLAILDSGRPNLPSTQKLVVDNRLDGRDAFEYKLRHAALQESQIDYQYFYSDNSKEDYETLNKIVKFTSSIGYALKNGKEVEQSNIDELNALMSKFEKGEISLNRSTILLAAKIIELANVGVEIIDWDLESQFNNLLEVMCKNDEQLKGVVQKNLSLTTNLGNIYNSYGKSLKNNIDGKYEEKRAVKPSLNINVDKKYTYGGIVDSTMNYGLDLLNKKNTKFYTMDYLEILNKGIKTNSNTNAWAETVINEYVTKEESTNVRSVKKDEVPKEQQVEDKTWYTDPKGNKYETREQLEESTPQVVETTPTIAPSQDRTEVVDDQPEIDVRIENVKPEEHIEVVPYVPDSTDTVSSSSYEESINDVNSSSIIQEEIEQLYEARNYITSEYSNNTLRK